MTNFYELETIIIGGPSYYAIDVTIKGRGAHAGMEPEKGINAIQAAAFAIAKLKLGRLDEETTAGSVCRRCARGSRVHQDHHRVTALGLLGARLELMSLALDPTRALVYRAALDSVDSRGVEDSQVAEVRA